VPTINNSQPEGLERYFSVLESFFTLHDIINWQERKQAALRYVSVRTESLWKTTEAWTNATKTYKEFKTSLQALPWLFWRQDLQLTGSGHTYRTLCPQWYHDLSRPRRDHREFLLISCYLSKNRIASLQRPSVTSGSPRPTTSSSQVH
jgi:hypothetical protein